MSLTDKTLTCRECGVEFVFTASEQEFYASKGFTNEPGRCPDCRIARKNQRNSSGSDRGGYNSRSSSYSREPREMHTVTCAQCGVETQVPFVPRGDRPVYCSTCYDAVRSSSRG